MQKGKENIVIVILAILIAGLLVGNVVFVIFAKSSLKKEGANKQKVEQVHGKDVSYESKVDNFDVYGAADYEDDYYDDGSSDEDYDTGDYSSDEDYDSGDSDSEVYYSDGSDDSDGDYEEDDYSDESDDSDEYVFYDSDSRKLKKSELTDLSKDELRIARNELYARHGYIFEDSGLKEYFSSKSWYSPSIKRSDFNDAEIFNKYEIANRNLIKKVEDSK